MVELYGCLFDDNVVTKTVGGAGGAIKLEGGATGIIAGCTFHNNRAGEDGGAIELNNNDAQQPYRTNVTITNTTFATNLAGEAGDGDDIKVHSTCTGGHAVPCPAPGTRCKDSCACCVNGDRTNWGYVLPTA